jgi:hypothetical protein
LKSAALLALRNVYKVASHTFHVYSWDLIPGTGDNESHVITRVRERRNQYLVQAKQAETNGLQLRSHSANDAAKDTLTFLHKHFVKENCDQFIIKWMLILRHTRDPGVNLYEWCHSFCPLIRTYLRTSDVNYLCNKKLHRVNKFITSQISNFEQAILTQISDKWKPLTLADGAFDFDELKRDISASDAKFAARKYKPTTLILEYLTSRATRQQVPLPSFMLAKSAEVKKKRSSDVRMDNQTKRFRKGRQRPLFLLDQDADENDEQDDQQDDDEEDHQDPDGAGESVWDSLAFEQRKSFPHCTTPFCKERNIAHTHSSDRCYKLHPQKGKGGSSKGSRALYCSPKEEKAAPREKAKAKEKAKESLEKTKDIEKAKGRRERTLVV